MKQKLLTSLLLLLSIVAPFAAVADDSFSVKAINVEQGGTATLQFNLQNSSTFYGFQAEVTLPAGLTAEKAADGNYITLTDRTKDGNYRVNSNLVNGTIIMGAFSLNNPHTAITGNDGVLAEMKVSVAKDFAGGTVRVSNIMMIDNVNQDVDLANSSTRIGLAASSITLSQTTADLKVNESVTLTATVLPEATADKSVTWTTSDETIATVDEDGKVTAKAYGKGTATITATCGNAKATCVVTVVATPVTGVSFKRTSLTLEPEETTTFVATIAPAAASNKSVTWASSNPAVASVDQNGFVTALAEGETEITATSNDNTTIKATCKLTVSKNIVKVTSITISDKTLSLTKGGTKTLTASVNEDATDQSITWESDDDEVATVSEDGVVTAVGAGTVTITASASNGLEATCVVTVTVPLESISISSDFTLEKGATRTLTVKYTPDDTTVEKKATWESSDPAVATVENGKVTAVSGGTATITAKVGDKTASCKVTVTVALESISIDKTLAMNKGDEKTLTVTYNPAGTTDDKSVVWSTSDAKVATVENGKVTAVGGGSATITVKSVADETIIATCKVTVTVPTTSLVIYDETNMTVLDDTHSLEFHVGDEYTLEERVEPSDATYVKVKWTSSDENVAKVIDIVEDPRRVHIDGIGVGEATITATLGTITRTFKVIVTKAVVEITGIKLDQTEAEMTTGGELTLKATVSPENATSKVVTWTSDNPSIATVSNGVVKALKAGKVTITATANKIEAKCVITITDPVVEVSEISFSESKVVLAVDGTATLVPTIKPENAEYKITWTSSNPDVVAIDESGYVKGLAIGEVTITATTSNGKTATCTVKVTEDGKDDTTAVSALGIDGNMPMTVYDLNGRKVSDKVEGLAKGIYIIRQGDNVKKVNIR